MNEKELEQWRKAQKYEEAFWIKLLTKELAPPSRDWYAGYVNHSFRMHCNTLGLLKNGWLDRSAFDGPLMDVGSGIVSMHEGYAYDVIALEPTLTSLGEVFPEIVIKGLYRNVDYIPMRIQEVTTKHYNTIWCCNMLDHTPDWKEIIEEQFPRVLRPNGRLYLLVDVRTGKTKIDAGHMGIFTAQHLLKLLEQNFKTERHTGFQPTPYYRWNYIGRKK